MCYIDDDTVSAETYIKKASFLVDLSTSEETRLQFKVCYARILDAKRKFLEAAMRYYEISQITTQASRIKLKIDIDDIKVFRVYQTYLCIIFLFRTNCIQIHVVDVFSSMLFSLLSLGCSLQCCLLYNPRCCRSPTLSDAGNTI